MMRQKKWIRNLFLIVGKTVDGRCAKADFSPQHTRLGMANFLADVSL
jgi:hypothetical protein